MVSIEHERFGTVEVPETELIHFDGLPGFPDARRFALLAHDRSSTFLWLVSFDDPRLAFVVTHPQTFFTEYEVPMQRRVLDGLGAKRAADIEILAIANLRGAETTLNLAAPLLVHAEGGRGIQVLIDAGQWSARQPLPPLQPSTDADGPASAQTPPSPQGDQIESKPQR